MHVCGARTLQVLEHVGRTDRRHHQPATGLSTSADTGSAANGLAAADTAATGSAANKPETAVACVIDLDAAVVESTSASAADVDFRSRDQPPRLDLELDYLLPVT